MCVKAPQGGKDDDAGHGELTRFSLGRGNKWAQYGCLCIRLTHTTRVADRGELP